MPKRSQTPADLLPADETAAYFRELTQSDARRLGNYFPSLSSLAFPLPEKGKDVSVAIVRLPDGSFGTVTFIGGETYTMMSVESLLQSNQPPLSSLPSYIRLRGVEGSRVFLDSTLLQPALGEEDRSLLRSLGDPHLLIAWDSDRMSVSFLPPAAHRPPLLSSPPPALSPAPDTVTAWSDGEDLPGGLGALLSPASRTTAESLLERLATELLGADLSLRYDLLPLLSEETAVAWTESGSQFFLEGGAGAATLDRVLPRLHENQERVLSTAVVRRRTFPEGYTSVTIEDDPSVLDRSTEKTRGWTVRRTVRTDTGEGLQSAVRGRRFILTNRTGWLEQAIASPPRPDLPGRSAFAGGILPRPMLRDSLRSLFNIALPDVLLSAFGPDGERLRWGISQEGAVMTLTVQTM